MKQRSALVLIALFVVWAVGWVQPSLAAPRVRGTVKVIFEEKAWYSLYPDQISKVLTDLGVSWQALELRVTSQHKVDVACGSLGSNYCFQPHTGGDVIILSNNPKLDTRYAMPLSKMVARAIADSVLYHNDKFIVSSEYTLAGETLTLYNKAGDLSEPYWAEKLTGLIVHKWVAFGEYQTQDGKTWH